MFKIVYNIFEEDCDMRGGDIMKSKVEYWMDLSDYDFDTANAMLQTKRYLYVGFMCHQSVEKILKAVLCSKNEALPPKIHNLLRLAEIADLLRLMDDKQKKTLYLLNPLNIDSRYPSYKDTLLSQLTEERCIEIINLTKELILWIKKQL